MTALGKPLALALFRPLTDVQRHDPALVEPKIWLRILECASDGAWPLMLIGNVGTGKTCAALSLLAYAGSRRYLTVAKLCETLIDVQAGRVEYGMKTDTVVAWWTRWRQCSLTVLDELGAREKVSDFQYETVKRAIDEREGLPAVFISNLSHAQLADVYDDRIASRLAAGTVIYFDGEDRRLR